MCTMKETVKERFCERSLRQSMERIVLNTVTVTQRVSTIVTRARANDKQTKAGAQKL